VSNEIADLQKRVDSLQEKIDGLISDHSIIEKYVKAQDASVKDAILTLVEALARVAHRSPHITAEEQKKIKKLLGVG
jgi:predicted  nucleic acid-binding Zn-ribbon protein